MKISPFFKTKPFFNAADNERVVQAIREAERQTNGEVRVYIESKNAYVDAMDRAAELFYNLKMDKTEQRNAVLLYIAHKDKEVALFGDEGIYKATGSTYWNEAVKAMLAQFKNENICEGIVQCIHTIGATLKDKFPYEKTSDKNELPDEIIFGK